jgi:hypothetical protein
MKSSILASAGRLWRASNFVWASTTHFPCRVVQDLPNVKRAARGPSRRWEMDSCLIMRIARDERRSVEVDVTPAASTRTSLAGGPLVPDYRTAGPTSLVGGCRIPGFLH